MKKYSYTALSMYNECGRKYFFHYIRNLREYKIKSYFLYGHCIDEGLNTLLENVGKPELEHKDPIAAFVDAWSYGYINDVKTELRTCKDIVYSNGDCEDSFLTDEDRKELNGDRNNDAWISLKRKGILMIEAYKEQIIPNIKRVLAVQKRIEIDNGEGDVIVGLSDLICEWKDGRIILFDNKTTSVKYKEDSVRTSPQLSTYYFVEKDEYKLDAAGYIAIPKNFRKKKLPLCEIDVIIDNIDESLIDTTFQTYNDSIHGIKLGTFAPNRDSCMTYGQKCPFYDVCNKNNYNGLYEKEYKKK